MKANSIPAHRAIVWLLSFCLLIGFQGLLAAEEEGKPFAEKHVVLQISDMDPSKQTLVLNVANNVLKHYGPDRWMSRSSLSGPD